MQSHLNKMIHGIFYVVPSTTHLIGFWLFFDRYKKFSVLPCQCSVMIMAMVLIGELGCVYWLIHVYEEISANLSRLYSVDHLILSKTWLRKIPVGVCATRPKQCLFRLPVQRCPSP